MLTALRFTIALVMFTGAAARDIRAQSSEQPGRDSTPDGETSIPPDRSETEQADGSRQYSGLPVTEHADVEVRIAAPSNTESSST